MPDPKDQADLDNHANQLNPNNDEYVGKDDGKNDHNNDNHSNQLNPNNSAYQGKK
jgi:hypothetical protein